MTSVARALDTAAIRFGDAGLVAAVCQDAADGRVLMVAWQDAEAVEATLRTDTMHFHSRSRGQLWRKGETSGNVLHVRGAAIDCDGDAILWSVSPKGPACHTGARSCFDLEPAPPDAPAVGGSPGFGWLDELWVTIESRARLRPAGSYTTRLLDAGVDLPARKVAEEAVEVLMAAKDDAVAQAAGDPARDQGPLAGEMADLLYHLLVLCAERGLPPADVITVLRARHAG